MSRDPSHARNDRGTKLSDTRKDKAEAATYLKSHPNATLRDIALECNMTERQARKYWQCPKRDRQEKILKLLAKRPYTTKELAAKLGISERKAWYAMSNLQGTGEAESAMVWRLSDGSGRAGLQADI